MTTISQIRTALASGLYPVFGRRVSSYVPDQINPPQAVVTLQRVNYDSAFGRGMDTFEFAVLAFVGRADERTGQDLLDGYGAGSGATSVKEALESDKTLGGLVFDLRVESMADLGPYLVGDTTYLTASFAVTVIAQ